jgi:hypothetical protein
MKRERTRLQKARGKAAQSLRPALLKVPKRRYLGDILAKAVAHLQ